MQGHTQEPTCYYFHLPCSSCLESAIWYSNFILNPVVTYSHILRSYTLPSHLRITLHGHRKGGKVVAGEKALIKAMSCPLLINLMASAGPLSLRTTLVKLKEYVPEVEVVVYVGKQIWWDEASREYTSRERCFRVVRIPRIQSDFH